MRGWEAKDTVFGSSEKTDCARDVAKFRIKKSVRGGQRW